MIYKSDFTVCCEVDNRYFLFNTLYGTLDELDRDTFLKYVKKSVLDKKDKKYLIDRKHIQVFEKAQYKEYIKLYEQYKKVRRRPIQFYIPLTLDCNMNCTYCFQKGKIKYEDLSEESINSIKEAIKFIKSQYEKEIPSEIILYGGEPLLKKNKHYIEKIFDICIELDIKIKIITNGINIPLIIEELIEYNSIISDIIITIDGKKERHDAARVLKNGGGTYEKIIKSISLLKTIKVPFTIRINATSSMLEDINDLRVEFKERILLYRVNNVDYSKNLKFKEIFRLLLEDKLKVEQVGLNPIKYLYYLINENYNSYPLFRYCDRDFIYLFSLDGKSIYHCNEKEENCVLAGTYAPIYSVNELYQYDNVFIEKECDNCVMLPICGGGCPFQRKTINKCLFFEEIMGMIQLYIEKLIN